MRFPGYWTDGQGDDVTLKFAYFDDTELTPESNWKLAYQNEEESWPSGFVDPLATLREICSRVRRGNERPGPMPIARENVIIRIQNTDDLALVTLHLLDTLSLAVGRPDERATR